MKCEFSERNYEKSLDFELTSSNQFFSPTQNQEYVLGIDSATLSGNEDFWSLWDPNWSDSPSIPRGVEITKDLWKWARGIPKIRHFPKIRANVFVQYKVPEYIESHNGKEYSYWRDSYFRYFIESKQNKRLVRLENNSTQSAVVVYASPAFWTYEQLMEHGINRTLVTNSNFTKPSQLTNHKRYTYRNSGTFGRGHSNSIEIKKTNLENEIENLTKISQNLELGITMETLSSQIDKTVNGFEDTKNKIDEQFQVNFQKTREYFLRDIDKKTDEVNYFLNVLSFVFLADLSWIVII